MIFFTPKKVQQPKSFCHAALSRFFRWATKPYAVQKGTTEAARIREMYRKKEDVTNSTSVSERRSEPGSALPGPAGPTGAVSSMRKRTWFYYEYEEGLEMIDEGEESCEEEASSEEASSEEGMAGGVIELYKEGRFGYEEFFVVY